MAQHDMNIANQGFPATRADLNNALQALASNSSGTSAPSTTFANQWWYDTTNNKLYIRNEANNAWIQVAVLDQTNNEWQITTGQISAADGDGLVFKTDDGNTRITLSDGGDVTFADGTDVITASAGTDNIRIGEGAGDSIASGGDNNVVIGKDAGTAITTGDLNTALGSSALKTISTHSNNVAIGAFAMDAGTGDNNVAVGSGALGGSSFSANSNVAVGKDAGNAITTGAENTLVGALAGDALTTGSLTAVGYQAGSAATTAVGNVFMGELAGASTTTGSDNTAYGSQAFTTNTTGADNVCIGHDAGRLISTGDANTIVGSHAGDQISTSNSHTAIGFESLTSCTTGAANTGVGQATGFKITTGSTNTFLGLYAGYYDGSSTSNGTTTGSNNTAIGAYSMASSATVSNQFTLGNNTIDNLRCNDTSISSLSDERDKTNIADIPLGLDFIKTLRPVSFDWNRRDGSYEGYKAFGFIAQELKTAQDATDYADHMRLVHSGFVDVDGEDQESLEADPMKTYPVLVKAVQELSAALDAALARIAVLEG
jgi:hypothetical protein